MEINVKTSKLGRYASEEKSISRDLKRLGVQVRACNRKLMQSMDSSASVEIGRALQSIQEQIENRAGKVESLGCALKTIERLYDTTEREIAGVTMSPQKIASANAISKFLNMFNIDEGAGGAVDIADMFSKFTKAIGGGSWMTLVGPIGKYVESFANFYWGDKNGFTGAKNYSTLAEKSAALWKALYKYYAGSKDALGAGMKRLSSQVGILGELFGITGNLATALDMKGKDWGEISSDFIKVGSGGVSLVKEIFEAKGGETSFGGGWFTFAKTWIGVGAQSIESYAKYSSDGKFTFMDGVETATDASTAGLTELIKGITFGVVNINEDEAADFLKNGAKNYGTDIGNYIIRNPYLYEKATKGNFFDKFCCYTVASVLVYL